jgi:hypothetical protein
MVTYWWIFRFITSFPPLIAQLRFELLMFVSEVTPSSINSKKALSGVRVHICLEESRQWK